MSASKPRPAVNELWLIDFGGPQLGEAAKKRPVLLVGPDNWPISHSGPVIVVPSTTARRGFRSHVHIDNTSGTGLNAPSYLQCELITSVPARRLLKRLGTAGPEVTCNVRGVLRGLLGIPSPIG